MQPINISNTNGQMFLDDESVFAPQLRGQERRAQQNALARQQSVRNALGNAIDPRTGRTNWEFAQQIGGADVAPELQQMRQADMMSQAEYGKKLADIENTRATASKASSEQEIAEMNEFATYLAPVRDQAGFSAWRNAYVQRYPFLGAMIPEAYTPEVKADILQKTKAKMENLRFGDEGNMQNVGRDPRTGALVSSGGQRTLSPYERAQIDISSRNAATAERRLALDQAGGASGTKPKNVTVSEQQAAYHGKRILDAAAQVAAATKKAPSANRPSALESAVQATPGVRGFVGGVRSAPRQIVTAAQREMLDALLYLATGAAYNKEQLEGEIESTLPAYLDKPETVRAKRDRLRLKIDAAKIRAGDAWTPEMDAALAVLDADAAAANTPANGVDTSNPLLGGNP
jgi:hypothetical protein